MAQIELLLIIQISLFFVFHHEKHILLVEKLGSIQHFNFKNHKYSILKRSIKPNEMFPFHLIAFWGKLNIN
jgi:hypothetical protein